WSIARPVMTSPHKKSVTQSWEPISGACGRRADTCGHLQREGAERRSARPTGAPVRASALAVPVSRARPPIAALAGPVSRAPREPEGGSEVCGPSGLGDPRLRAPRELAIYTAIHPEPV